MSEKRSILNNDYITNVSGSAIWRVLRANSLVKKEPTLMLMIVLVCATVDFRARVNCFIVEYLDWNGEKLIAIVAIFDKHVVKWCLKRGRIG